MTSAPAQETAAGDVQPACPEPGGSPRPPGPGMLGFSALELVIMELAWAAGGWLSAGEVFALLDQRRPTARRTAESVVAALVRKGHLERSSRDGTWRYRPVRPLAAHLAMLISSLLECSPDTAATLEAAGASRPGRPEVRIAVCYDGWWYQHAAEYLARERGTGLSIAGLHDAIRWHAAGLFEIAVRDVTISAAHYIGGRDGTALAQHEDELADRGIIRHDVPVTASKEVGGDVELALTCYELAAQTRPDMIALLAGDGDFAPLAARLTGRGIRVLIPVADFTYPRPGDGATRTVRTSTWLTRRATDTPDLTSLLAAADRQSYPPFLARPFPPAPPRGPGQPERRHGRVNNWQPGATYGFIAADDGQTWFAPIWETHDRARLEPGTPVTFTGDPSPPPGKTCPAATDIIAQVMSRGAV
jgi:predicted transcriptional regulator/uncharacterized LabA/DUF88 family protein